MKFYSLVKKLCNVLNYSTFSRSSFIYPNLYLFNLKQEELKNIKSVLFWFNSEEYMHLGDHIFFIPLVKVFIDSGFKVEVATTNPMFEVFKAIKLNVVYSAKEFSSYDLVISRFELVSHLKNVRSLLVHISKNITQPICDHMLFEFGRFFKLNPYVKPDYSVFYIPDILEKFTLPTNKKLVFINLYCNSSSYLITNQKRQKILSFANNYVTNKDYQLVLVGSDNDKLYDKIDYGSSYIDLRGKTSVMDIFHLVAHENVLYYIGFDAFVMHVFSIFEKRSFVVFRGRITKKQSNMLKKYHVKLFKADNYVTCIN